MNEYAGRLYIVRLITPVSQNIPMKEIYLASTSPRRVSILKELLGPFNISFKTVNPHFNELENGRSPRNLVSLNAKGKVESLKDKIKSNALIVSADTVVSVGDDIIGKPRNNIEAKEFLIKLSGRSHNVFTGVAILDTRTGQLFEGCGESTVTFYDLTDEDIDRYVSTSEPLDKAGGYGIQGLGEKFVKKMEGEYSNIVGLPTKLTFSLLEEAGIFIS